ncbi:penicillin-binding transpeptidase domain-containing protein [Nakamurella sp. GG22]
MTLPRRSALRRRVRYRWVAVAVAMLVGVTACTGAQPATTPGPELQLAAFVDALQEFDAERAGDLTSNPAAATLFLDEIASNLSPDSVTVSAGSTDRTADDTATIPVTYTWTFENAGTLTYPATWTWERNGDEWALTWSPTVVHPKLGERQTLAIRTTDPQQGVLVDRENVRLVSPIRVFAVELKAARPDLKAAAAALAPILASVDKTVTADSIVAGATDALAQAAQPPDEQAPSGGASPSSDSATVDPPVDPKKVTYTVINLREPDYRRLADQLDAVGGLTFPSETRNLPPTKDFAKAVLAQVTPVAAEMMTGTKGWKVIIVDTTGGTLETLADHPAVAGARVTLTLDSTLQRSAEAILAKRPQPAALVVMQPSTGELLAVAQNAAANAEGSIALTGQYPPGSTFKVVTATAALDRGLIVPGKPVDCPGIFTVDGRQIRNSHDFDLGTVDSTVAFAKSCNTTFAGLSAQMPADALPAAASDYGIGLDFVMPGATTLTGKVPDAPSEVQRAENGFGQGQVVITPFSAVLMAATAANGTMPMPVLIRGTKTTVDKPAPVRTAQVQKDIQSYLKAVVDQGTASDLQAFGDVHAKTGTAEFTGEDGKTHAHAWMIGYRGDLAFAALVVGGESSTVTTAMIGQFLGTLTS